MQWRMGTIKWLCLVIALTACSTPKNNEKPVFGNKIYQYKGWVDYCQRHPKDVDCKEQVVPNDCLGCKEAINILDKYESCVIIYFYLRGGL